MVFALDKDKIARCFLRSIASYDQAAEVQNKLADRLLLHLADLPDNTFASVLEIGCCTGTLTEKLCLEKPVQKLYCNDLVLEFEDLLRKKLSCHHFLQFLPCFGDIEEQDLPPELSLVISGATFQWLSDLPSFIKRLGRDLPQGACLAFSLFGPGTLQEFSGLTGVELAYMSDNRLKSLLEMDFELIHHAAYQDTLYFQTVKEILGHIRDTGVGGVSEYKWSKGSLQDFEKAYIRNFASDKGLPLSYSSSCFVAKRK
jgi:malonyl-CoA O-methyltransferase